MAGSFGRERNGSRKPEVRAGSRQILFEIRDHASHGSLFVRLVRVKMKKHPPFLLGKFNPADPSRVAPGATSGTALHRENFVVEGTLPGRNN